MKTPFMLTLCVLAGCSNVGVNRAPAGAAAGGTAPPSASTSFIEADLDGDARISPREYDLRRGRDGGPQESFEAADTNGDGVLTFDEWQALVGPRRAAAGATVQRGR